LRHPECIVYLYFSDPLVFDNVTAALVLKQLSYDGYKDDGSIPYGYKFKVTYFYLIPCKI
jgi:hypothetical protein